MLDSLEIDVNQWVATNQQLINEHTAKNYPNLVPDTLTYTEGGRYYKVVKHGGVHAFIAKEDFVTKGMGQVYKGDIFKPASWNAPAKHARGNIYDESKGMSQMNPYGPNYLRG